MVIITMLDELAGWKLVSFSDGIVTGISWASTKHGGLLGDTDGDIQKNIRKAQGEAVKQMIMIAKQDFNAEVVRHVRFSFTPLSGERLMITAIGEATRGSQISD